ncbi:MAG: Protein serine/threonine phosphatase-containing protein [Candidatus Magnetoglobus multicellularis str. Araruama]|uniref:Protein serine/threonine phosphatase-containing protein n=1 Tax=Candidatus Magnetoglobus multicellularis str. Araruama TaxID=890399 RepID=A0A1V1P2F3_9BACT|nr:MAG: Protein serine/threonine phosphatase-containing protein [Candidatus Magnetoglobus multicellularis str. Araruama]
MKIDVQQLTDPGPRDENQDEMGWFTLQNGGQLFIVADGVGGAIGGKEAAKIAVATTNEIFQKYVGKKQISNILQTAINTANIRIYKKGHSGNSNFQGMTTIVILYIENKKAYLAHIGDSRIYHYRARNLILLTKDHSRVQQMVDDKLISEEIAFDHPEGNVITRALGREQTIEPDICKLNPFHILPGDRFMLCSDGLCGVLRKEILSKLFHTYENDPKHLCKEFIKRSLNEGGSDNITVQIISFEGTPPTPVNTISDSHLLQPAQSKPTESKTWFSKKNMFMLVACFLLIGLIVVVSLKIPDDKQTETGTTARQTVTNADKQENQDKKDNQDQQNAETKMPDPKKKMKKDDDPKKVVRNEGTKQTLNKINTRVHENKRVIEISINKNKQLTLEDLKKEISDLIAKYKIKKSFTDILQSNNLNQYITSKDKNLLNPSITIRIIVE